MSTLVLHSWLKPRCSRLTISPSGACKGLVSFNQLYHQVFLFIFNPNLSHQTQMICMKTFFSQQITLTLPRFLALFPKVSFSLFLFYLYARFSHLNILSMIYSFLVFLTFFSSLSPQPHHPLQASFGLFLHKSLSASSPIP